ncbi:hypothetical protein F0L68_17985 [Solihabitans fulvus]|uniref:Sigma-70, region 4 n=1 Tax=Solihabitans fulvus TaxID=1892852 RepID=A0A5B2XEW2_9PSEU|nr:hypothetical protein [Solihabitans fulvus]KAA2261332.1 hypothetical protein F0L68_17985 [Solihabitans fulvus]
MLRHDPSFVSTLTTSSASPSAASDETETLRELREASMAFRAVTAAHSTTWHNFLDRLPAIQRNVLIVVCLEGIPISRTAEMLTMEPMAVAAILTRAMRTMIEHLRGEGWSDTRPCLTAPLPAEPEPSDTL